MATTSTDSMPPGTPAPTFTLPDVATGEMRTLEELAGLAGTLIVFLCAHCPYVIHVQEKLSELAREFSPLGISTLGISANDVLAYPDDSPEKLREMAERSNLPFPILYDEPQRVAASYTAACTPDFFLFDVERRLAYRGRLDASTPGNGLPVNGEDLKKALKAVVARSAVTAPWPPALGCSIKWKEKGRQ